MDRTPGFSLQFVTQELNIADGEALAINGVVDIPTNSSPVLRDRATLERIDLELADGTIWARQRCRKLSFECRQIGRRETNCRRGINIESAPRAAHEETVSVCRRKRMLKQGVVCEKQRDALCYVAICGLEQGQNTRVACCHGMQCYLADHVTELLDVLKIGNDSVAIMLEPAL